VDFKMVTQITALCYPTDKPMIINKQIGCLFIFLFWRWYYRYL